MSTPKPSFDIADPAPPSPAPTYHSSTYFEKRSKSTSAPPNSPQPSPQIDNKSFHTHTPTPQARDFKTLEEPHDPNHPFYAPPHTPPLPPPTAKPPQRLTRLSLLLPWTLAALFFLTTLLCTSAFLTTLLYSSLHPPRTPSINIQINGQDIQAAPSAVFSASISRSMRATPAPLPSTAPGNEDGAGGGGNDFDTDEGTNTVTSQIAGFASGSVGAIETEGPRSTLVTVTKRAEVTARGLCGTGLRC